MLILPIIQLLSTRKRLHNSNVHEDRKIAGIVKFLYLSVLISLLSSPCAAQAWGPEKIEITCTSQECLSPEKRGMIEGFANEILAKLKKYGFEKLQKTHKGNRLGDFVPGRGGSLVIQITYDHEMDEGVAYATSPCNMEGEFEEEKSGKLVLGPDFNSLPDHIIYLIIAHEIFHTFQYSQPVYLQSEYCEMPMWFSEGSATFVGIVLMEEHFGKGSFHPPLNSEFAPYIYGLRPYFINFTATEAFYAGYLDASGQVVPGPRVEDRLQYKGASFWQYIADRYHHGSLKYLARWMSHPMIGDDDWLKWLDNQLFVDESIKTRLYMVFPDFQANFATWVTAKYNNLNTENWLNIAYYGCSVVDLNTQHPSQQLKLKLEPLSAHCIRIRGNGISSSNVVSIKVMAVDKNSSRLDNLHLSMATLSPKVRSFGGAFNCYKKARNVDWRPACLYKPFTGKHLNYKVNKAQTRWVKTWLNEPQILEKGNLENLYLISNSPLDPSDSLHESREPQSVMLTLGLDITIMKNTATGKAKRASSIINLKSGSPVPMQGSEDPTQISNEDKVSKAAYHISKNAASNMRITDKGILSISVTDRALESDEDDQLQGGISFTINPYDMRIPFGAKGKFPAKLTTAFEFKRVLNANSIIVMVPEEQVMGSINVMEFSETLLHLQIKGHFCRIGNLDKKTGKCNKIETVETTIIKPFGWAYDGAQDFVSIDTPGMAEYRRVLSSALSVESSFPFPMPDIPSIPMDIMTTGGTGTSDGFAKCVQLPEGVSTAGYSADINFCTQQDALPNNNNTSDTFTLTDPMAADCSCTCSEMKTVHNLSDQITNVPETADGRPDMSALKLEKLSCIFKCAKEYAACK